MFGINFILNASSWLKKFTNLFCITDDSWEEEEQRNSQVGTVSQRGSRHQSKTRYGGMLYNTLRVHLQGANIWFAATKVNILKLYIWARSVLFNSRRSRHVHTMQLRVRLLLSPQVDCSVHIVRLCQHYHPLYSPLEAKTNRKLHSTIFLAMLQLYLTVCFTVQQLLENKPSLGISSQVVTDLQALAQALLETVNDKNLALSHQRKTNK